MTALQASAPRERSQGTPEDVELVQVLDTYLAALEAGRPPDPEQLIAAHPAIGERLRSCLASLQLVEQAAGSFAAGEVRQDSSGAVTGCLGDFRLLREVGRGGMGVVYEAEQISLGRRVALKVLPFAATMDPRHLQRFHNEARAAASLHHEHIVPVYAVGQERGVHYYAMQFIEGQTLADLIHGLRPAEPANSDAGGPYPPAAASTSVEAGLTTPRTNPHSREFFRTAARLGIEAAQALDYAHQLGIVHRDVKPSNLLLDAAGKLWVTDFGLAHVVTDTSLTLTGDLLGTLRYMSPGQALAKRVPIDHRTDVYSLGVTLYELLTLQPAVGGEDRHEVLRQIASEEPVSPRRINKAVPADLETIIFKAMEKAPVDRYATAQELADDLRRFLEDRPIRARRPTLRQRVARWSRQHRSLVGSAIVVLVLLVVGLTISTLLILRQQRQTQAALDQAEQQRQRAEANLARTYDVMDRFLKRVGHQRLAGEPRMERLRRELLQDALKYHQELLEENSTDPAGRQQTGIAYLYLASINQLLGRLQEAESACRHAQQVFQQLVDEFPDRPQYRADLSKSYEQLGRAFFNAGRAIEAEHPTRQALALREQLIVECPQDPAYRHQLARSHSNLGLVLMKNKQFEQAEQGLRRAIDLLETLVADFPEKAEYKSQLALACMGLAELLVHTQRAHGAEEYCRKAVRLQEQLSRDSPDDLDYREELAGGYVNWANALAQTNQMQEAEQAYLKGIAQFERLTADFPGIPVFRLHLLSTYHNLALFYPGRGEFRKAEQASRQALEGFLKLAAEFPSNGTFQKLLANIQYSRALFLATCPDRGLRSAAAEVALAEKAIEHNPSDARLWLALGITHYGAGAWPEARAALEKTMQLRRGGNSQDWFWLAMIHWQLGHKDEARQWFDKAVRWMDKNNPNHNELRRLRAEAAALLQIDDRPKDQPEQKPP